MRYGKKDNDIANELRKKRAVLNTDEFCRRKDWRELRTFVLAWYGRKCMRCSATQDDGVCINVDHIKPRKTHLALALEFSNLQVLCGRCNKKKGNRHSKDYRV